MFPLISLVFAALVFGFMALFTVLAYLAKSRRAAILYKTLAVLPFTGVCVALMVMYCQDRQYAVAFAAIPLVWALISFAPEILSRIYHVFTTPPEED